MRQIRDLLGRIRTPRSQTIPKSVVCIFRSKKRKKTMTLTNIEWMSAQGQTFMLTASMGNHNLLTKKARIRQNALTPVRFAECGLFA
jgi:hypothetical protein